MSALPVCFCLFAFDFYLVALSALSSAAFTFHERSDEERKTNCFSIWSYRQSACWDLVLIRFNLLVNPDSAIISYKVSFNNSLIRSHSTAGLQQLLASLSDEQNNQFSSYLTLLSVLLIYYLTLSLI